MFIAGILTLELVLRFQTFKFLRNELFVYLLHTGVRCLEKGTVALDWKFLPFVLYVNIVTL